MAGNTINNISSILNRVAAEVGITPVVDPMASADPFFIQCRLLLLTAGEELLQAYPWEKLIRTHTITTADGDTGVYDMPADFAYFVNQTQWDETNRVPMGGPLSAQEWTYLKGRNLASQTLYASFRQSQGKFNVYPSPPAAGLTLSFEYISTDWVYDFDASQAAGEDVYIDNIEDGADFPVFDKTLITRALKVKYLEAGGFDTTKAQADYNQIFAFLTGTDKGAPVLDAGLNRAGIPLLSSYNTPDTGFGS